MKAWITGLQLWPLPPVWKCSDLSPLKWLICGSGDATNEIYTIPSSCCQCHHLLPPEVDNPSRWNEPTCACYMGAGTSGTMHGEAAIPFNNSWKGCRWTNLLDVVWRSVNSHVRFYSWGLCLAGSWRHVARTPPLANDKRLCVCCDFSGSPHTFFSSATVPHCSTSVLLCKNVFPAHFRLLSLKGSSGSKILSLSATLPARIQEQGFMK